MGRTADSSTLCYSLERKAETPAESSGGIHQPTQTGGPLMFEAHRVWQLYAVRRAPK